MSENDQIVNANSCATFSEISISDVDMTQKKQQHQQRKPSFDRENTLESNSSLGNAMTDDSLMIADSLPVEQDEVAQAVVEIVKKKSETPLEDSVSATSKEEENTVKTTEDSLNDSEHAKIIKLEIEDLVHEQDNLNNVQMNSTVLLAPDTFESNKEKQQREAACELQIEETEKDRNDNEEEDEESLKTQISNRLDTLQGTVQTQQQNQQQWHQTALTSDTHFTDEQQHHQPRVVELAKSITNAVIDEAKHQVQLCNVPVATKSSSNLKCDGGGGVCNSSSDERNGSSSTTNLERNYMQLMRLRKMLETFDQVKSFDKVIEATNFPESDTHFWYDMDSKITEKMQKETRREIIALDLQIRHLKEAMTLRFGKEKLANIINKVESSCNTDASNENLNTNPTFQMLQFMALSTRQKKLIEMEMQKMRASLTQLFVNSSLDNLFQQYRDDKPTTTPIGTANNVIQDMQVFMDPTSKKVFRCEPNEQLRIPLMFMREDGNRNNQCPLWPSDSCDASWNWNGNSNSTIVKSALHYQSGSNSKDCSIQKGGVEIDLEKLDRTASTIKLEHSEHSSTSKLLSSVCDHFINAQIHETGKFKLSIHFNGKQINGSPIFIESFKSLQGAQNFGQFKKLSGPLYSSMILPKKNCANLCSNSPSISNLNSMLSSSSKISDAKSLNQSSIISADSNKITKNENLANSIGPFKRLHYAMIIHLFTKPTILVADLAERGIGIYEHSNLTGNCWKYFGQLVTDYVECAAWMCYQASEDTLFVCDQKIRAIIEFKLQPSQNTEDKFPIHLTFVRKFGSKWLLKPSNIILFDKNVQTDSNYSNTSFLSRENSLCDMEITFNKSGPVQHLEEQPGNILNLKNSSNIKTLLIVLDTKNRSVLLFERDTGQMAGEIFQSSSLAKTRNMRPTCLAMNSKLQLLIGVEGVDNTSIEHSSGCIWLFSLSMKKETNQVKAQFLYTIGSMADKTHPGQLRSPSSIAMIDRFKVAKNHQAFGSIEQNTAVIDSKSESIKIFDKSGLYKGRIRLSVSQTLSRPTGIFVDNINRKILICDSGNFALKMINLCVD